MYVVKLAEIAQEKGYEKVSELHRAIVRAGHSVSERSLRIWWNKEGAPTSEHLGQLAEFLGVDPGELLYKEGDGDGRGTGAPNNEPAAEEA